MEPFESVLMRWKNLQPIIQSEISQKNKYRIVLIYMESRKTVLMNLFMGQQWRYRQRTDLWTRVRRRKVRVGQMERVQRHIPYCA